MADGVKEVAVIGGKPEQTRSYGYFHGHSAQTEALTYITDPDVPATRGIRFDEIRLVGTWYLNPKLSTLYLSTLTHLKPEGKVIVVL